MKCQLSSTNSTPSSEPLSESLPITTVITLHMHRTIQACTCILHVYTLFTCMCSQLSDGSLQHLITALCQLSLDGVVAAPGRVSIYCVWRCGHDHCSHGNAEWPILKFHMQF